LKKRKKKKKKEKKRKRKPVLQKASTYSTYQYFINKFLKKEKEKRKEKKGFNTTAFPFFLSPFSFGGEGGH
jgi:hypothetical protein